MDFLAAINNIMGNLGKGEKINELNKYLFTYEDEDQMSFYPELDSYSYVVYPFFNNFPYLCIMINHEGKNIVRGRIYSNFEEFRWNENNQDFESYNLCEIVEILADLVVDLFSEKSFEHQLWILEQMALDVRTVIEDFEDPRTKIIEKSYPSIKFPKPDFSYLTDLKDFPDFFISALGKSRDICYKDAYHRLLEELASLGNDMNYSYMDENLDKEEVVDEIHNLVTTISEIVENFERFKFLGPVTKIQTISNRNKFDWYLQNIVDKAIEAFEKSS
ncbi:hypothetical protein [Bacillus sp. REN16]|uniref:hypothetical protein n=1 Tax=Bacillus sp. REN16 TaxID=2887296 RepID=UPI001E43F7CB|nr:hypothetical protein [Bacillus sp. REN16]MCC3359451.1 hypothetical protein [Bacillus sp. REN16]